MAAQIVLLGVALLMGIPGLLYLFRPERVHFFFERLKYQEPLEPSAFRRRALRLQGVVLSLGSAALIWLAVGQPMGDVNTSAFAVERNHPQHFTPTTPAPSFDCRGCVPIVQEDNTDGLLPRPFVSAIAYHRYQEYQEDGDYDARYDDDGHFPDDEFQDRPARREAGSDGIGIMIWVGLGLLAVYRLFRSSRGKSRAPGVSRGGGGYDYQAGVGGYARQEEPPAREVSRQDASTGHFWGNDEDGTRVKSLWGTTKDE